MEQLLVAACLAGAVLVPAADTTELSRLESVWNEAHKAGDIEALDLLWAEDLVVTVPRMAVLSKGTALGNLRHRKFKFERYETTDIRIREYGDAAVVTGRLQRTRSMGAAIVDDDWRFTKVYVRHAGRWQVVSFQASEAAP